MVFPAVLLLVTLLSGAAPAEPAKTSKERLSDKASDEQRIDNCGVAPERRGPTPRPDCATPPSGRPAATSPGGARPEGRH